MTQRRWFVPEVIQTSGMDCGPAALAALLAGFGLPASYGRLRDACHTDVDGTSIDTLEDIANVLGLSATQLLVPPDHLGDDCLPAIVLIRTPEGIPHFVVAWRRVGRWIQLMDPAVGRRWTTMHRFRSELELHEMDLPATAVAGLASSAAFGAKLTTRIEALGADTAEARGLVDAAVARGPVAVYGLDAAVRAATRGRASHPVVAEIAARAEADPNVVPAGCWFARPVGNDEDVHLRGAVLVSAERRADVEDVDPDAVPESLRAVAAEPAAGPVASVMRLAGGWRAALVGLALAGAAGVMAPLVGHLGREAIDGASASRLAAIAWTLLLLEAVAAAHAAALGRRAESSFRLALFDRVPRLPDHYFRSRPTSDTTERAHRIHGVHQLPEVGSLVMKTVVELVAVGVALALIRPGLATVVLLATVVAIGVPLVASPMQQERDLRVRTHGGALGRSWLDAVAGRTPIRAHRAERTFEHDNEAMLQQWVDAAGSARRLAVGVEAVQAATGILLAVTIVAAADAQGASGSEVLLVAFWALRLAGLGQILAGSLRRWPLLRAVTMRFLEPLSAPTDGPDPRKLPVDQESGIGGIVVEVDSATVKAASHTVLDECSFTLDAGEHVAIVGPTGAGKSTLVGLILGLVRPAHGTVRIDDRELDGESSVGLRRSTAWIAPEVTLWRGSLDDNVTYGSGDDVATERVAAHAELTDVVTTLSGRWSTPLGDSGRRLSGGEGQRVRVARALGRRGVRLALLDEAFRGLPAGQRRRLLQRCRQHWSAATLVHVTHDIAEALTFDRVLVVDEGKVVEDGIPSELALQPSSRFADLLRRDHDRRSILDGPAWRRLELVRGQFIAAPGPLTVAPHGRDPGNDGSARTPSQATDAQLDALRRAAPRWWPEFDRPTLGTDLPGAAAAMGLRAELVMTTRARLARVLAHGRFVVCHSDGGGTAVVRGRGASTAIATLVADSPPAASVGSFMAADVAAALMASESADDPVSGVWRIRPDPAVSLATASRWVGLPLRIAAFTLSHVVEIAGYVVAFATLGRDALDASVGVGTLARFGLALALTVPARAASVALGQRIAVDAGVILKRRLLRGALSLSPEAAREEGVGRVMGRIVEAEAVEDQAVAGALGASVAIVELTAAAAVLAAGMHGGLATGALAGFVVMAVVGTAALTRRKRDWATARLDMSVDLVEKLLGQRTRVVQQSPEDWGSGEVEQVLDARDRSRRVDRLTVAMMMLAPAWLAVGATALAVAGTSNRTGLTISIGGVLLATGGLERLGRGAADLAGAVAAFDACRPLSAAAAPLAAVPSSDASLGFAVAAEEVVVTHPHRGASILDGTSLHVAHRERVVLRGASGSGKSTLATVLAGLRDPDSGTVNRSGSVVLAAQFHENHVLLGSIGFNLLLGRGWPHSDADIADAERVCVALGLDRLLARMPNGLDQVVGETGWQLSHGETHLLNIGRALLQGGDLVVLDESLDALDPVTAGTVLKSLHDALPAVLVIAQN